MMLVLPHELQERAVWKVMALLCLATTLHADSAAARRNRPYYGVQRIHGDVALNLGHDKDIRKTTGQPDLDEGELLLQEELNLGGSGWLYHPAMARLDADFGLIFNQDFLDSKSGGSTDTNANQLNYNIRLGLLPYKPYPMSAYVSQLRSEINSPFTPRRIIDTFRYGAGLTMREHSIGQLDLRSRAQYRHEETETSSFSGGRDDTRDRDEFEFISRNDTERTRSRGQYSWKSIETQGRATSSKSERHDVRTYHERRLDNGDLTSQFFFTDNGGDFDSRALAFNNNLRLLHDHNLQSNYSYSLSHQDSGSSDQLAHTGQVGISHQLYESLTSGLHTNGSYADSDLGRTWTAGGGADLNYSKRVPGGTLGLRLNPSYLYTDEDIEGGIRSIINEAHDIVVGPPIILNQPLAIPSTVVVQDPATLQTFIESIDYDLIQLGVEVGIRVIPGSELDPAVPPLTPVMVVSYDYLVEPARTFETLTLSAGTNLHLWDHLTLDFDYTKANQNLIKGAERQLTLDDSRRIRTRVQLDFPLNRTRFEYENFDSDITPRERYTLTHDFSMRPTPRTSVGLGAGYDRDKITDTGRVTETVSFNANGTAVLPYAILGRLNVLARWIDQVEQETIGVGGTVAFSYRYRRLRFETHNQLTWRRTDSKSGMTRRTRELVNTFFFRIVRPF